MAASGGHLELCRFLLRESSLFNEDALMLSALDRSLRHAYYYQRDQRLVESFYDLLARDNTMEYELRDSLEQRADQFSILHTTASFDVVLARQSVPFLSLPFAQRFDTALASVGWPPDAFLTSLDHHDPEQLARKATKRGKTALHWAAQHFGTWVREYEHGIFGSNASARAQGYAKLASRLVSMGADVHSLWHYNEKGASVWTLHRDSFLCFLGGLKIDSYALWDKEGIARAVDLWGHMLVDAGLSLPDYVEAENKYLSSIQNTDMDTLPLGERGRSLALKKLLISEQSTLLLEVKEFSRMDIWKEEAAKIPGAWPMSSTLPDTIIWHPEKKDSRAGMRWVRTGSVYRIYEEKTTETIDKLRLMHNDLLNQAQRNEMESTQDDHGLTFLLLGQRRELCQQTGATTLNRRRASSCPPSFRTFESHPKNDETTRDMMIFTPSACIFEIHKCPFDSRWRSRSSDWRSCMQGQCQESLGSRLRSQRDSFESWFLHNEAYSHVARRYAEKFCPERMHIVDRVHERATQRARLAMGPKRKEDVVM
jgi:hypothetical protein